MDYYTYILYSQKLDKFYVGSTNDVVRRLADHNRGKSGFTRTGTPWILKYSEKFNDRASAVRREMEIYCILMKMRSNFRLDAVIPVNLKRLFVQTPFRPV